MAAFEAEGAKRSIRRYERSGKCIKKTLDTTKRRTQVPKKMPHVLRGAFDG